MFALQALQMTGGWYIIATYATRLEARHAMYNRGMSITRTQRMYRIERI